MATSGTSEAETTTTSTQKQVEPPAAAKDEAKRNDVPVSALDKDGLVTITHAKTKGTTRVRPRSVKVWAKSGWTLKK